MERFEQDGAQMFASACRPGATRAFQQTPPQFGLDFSRAWQF